MHASTGGLWNTLLQLFENFGPRNSPTRCYCPHCRQELCAHGHIHSDDGDVVTYICARCETRSRWYFNAPIPLLLGP